MDISIKIEEIVFSSNKDWFNLLDEYGRKVGWLGIFEILDDKNNFSINLILPNKSHCLKNGDIVTESTRNMLGEDTRFIIPQRLLVEAAMLYKLKA